MTTIERLDSSSIYNQVSIVSLINYPKFQYQRVVLTFHITSLREVKTLGLLKWQLGFNKKNIDIELKENNLTITCSKKNETREDAVEFVTKVLRKKLLQNFCTRRTC